MKKKIAKKGESIKLTPRVLEIGLDSLRKKKIEKTLLPDKKLINWFKNPFKKVGNLYGIKFITVKKFPFDAHNEKGESDEKYKNRVSWNN